MNFQLDISEYLHPGEPEYTVFAGFLTSYHSLSALHSPILLTWNLYYFFSSLHAFRRVLPLVTWSRWKKRIGKVFLRIFITVERFPFFIAGSFFHIAFHFLFLTLIFALFFGIFRLYLCIRLIYRRRERERESLKILHFERTVKNPW